MGEDLYRIRTTRKIVFFPVRRRAKNLPVRIEKVAVDPVVVMVVRMPTVARSVKPSNSSGSGGGTSDDVPTEQDSPSGIDDDEEQPSVGSISSTATVVSKKTSRDRHSCHKDVVFNNDNWMSRKKRPEEVTSLERSFELNYEEVFNKSNIPQLIANTSGKIVTWNECFAKATGYRHSDIERMTIFSLVKPENLANFFEIVAT